MAIEKRVIAGQTVGYNTETHSFCNLPKDWVDPDAQPAYDSMSDEQLATLAAEHGIDMAKIKTRAALIEALEKAGQ